jgi:hypothetical protein
MLQKVTYEEVIEEKATADHSETQLAKMTKKDRGEWAFPTRRREQEKARRPSGEGNAQEVKDPQSWQGNEGTLQLKGVRGKRDNNGLWRRRSTHPKVAIKQQG